MDPVRLVDTEEQHFTEGEPDIEPPEELAISELDETAQLEEGLDNEDVLEQDVDETVLEETLEDLVHVDDDEDDEAPESPVGLVVAGAEAFDGQGSDDDVEEGLDLILEHRLAIVSDGDVEAQDDDAPIMSDQPMSADATDDEVRPCGPGEFTCQSCFLVHSRAMLVDAAALICRDCSV
jgi:hypothetical protein